MLLVLVSSSLYVDAVTTVGNVDANDAITDTNADAHGAIADINADANGIVADNKC